MFKNSLLNCALCKCYAKCNTVFMIFPSALNEHNCRINAVPSALNFETSWHTRSVPIGFFKPGHLRVICWLNNMVIVIWFCVLNYPVYYNIINILTWQKIVVWRTSGSPFSISHVKLIRVCSLFGNIFKYYIAVYIGYLFYWIDT